MAGGQTGRQYGRLYQTDSENQEKYNMIEERYKADTHRYDTMIYRRCGHSGLLLPSLSLGLWHNFGSIDDYDTYLSLIHI